MSAFEVPGADDEGHVDEDRQDPPRPEKTTAPDEGDDGGDLDGFTATPGDRPEDDDA